MKLSRLKTNSMDSKKLREARRTPWDRKFLGQQGKIDAYFKAASRSLAVYRSLTQLCLPTFFRNSANVIRYPTRSSYTD